MSRSQQLVVGGFLAAVLLAPAASRAQSDVTPALPNVLILLDTSGSMERKPNATLPGHLAGTTSTTEKTRWVQALEVLGGSLEGYRLLHQPRNTTDFRDEFGLGGQAPYDYDYYLPHFRPLSNDCAIGSTSLSTTKSWPVDWKTWGTSSFGFRKWSGASLGAVGSCGPTDYKTDGLGILDTFRDQARFGLMTFDTTPDPKTGWTGSAHDPLGGMNGTWSYFPGWDGAGTFSPTYGWPAGCTIDPGSLSSHLHELGARNPSAPPWEGPLVPFADDDSTTALRTVNDRIRYAMLAARPYGATPLGPMLADAQHYLWNDPKGPKIDPKATCRGNFVILITDGFPNSDLRPNCENNPDPKMSATWPGCDTATGGGGCCPTKRPQDITYDLAHPPADKPEVKTFVVGFALSDDMGAPVDCNSIDPKSGICSTSTLDPKYRPCCTLHEMAFNGGTDKALLANDTDTLRAALVDAMSKATASTSTSRTVPVFAPGVAASGGGQYEFRSSFKVNAFGPWTGVLERIRWECKGATAGGAAAAVDLDAAKGDDFANNLNKMAARNFYTWDGVSSGGGARSGHTMRPNLASADGDGMSYTPAPTMINASGSSFVNNVSPAMMDITSPCADTTTVQDCRTKLLNYALALPQPKPTWQSRVGLALGDIYHATPVAVGPPSAFLRDESYTAFRNKPAIATRPPFMLTATNDGLLHAFKASVTSDADPDAELFAFIPPAVLPHIGKQYGGAHALLLDAAPVVKDVAFGVTTSTRPWGRTSTDARGGTGNWRSVAVGGLTTGRGYYAIDVTEPKNPKLLWQLTKWNNYTGPTASSEDLFGLLPGAPAIGTVYLDDGGTKVETPVAFLPGGEGTQFAPGTCNRWPRTTPTSTDPTTTPRTKVRCWTGPGNSFTIVRLYDGKILRTFRNDPTPGDGVHPTEPTSATTQIEAAGKASQLILGESGLWPTIDSPITGAVALYPGATGTVTTRAFVGDQDGTLWKLDVSDPKPERWTFDIFHDAYFPSDSANTNPAAWGPVAIPPVLTVDRFGDIVVNYATGDQNNFSTTYLNHVYSITERTALGTGGVKTITPKLNWHIKLSGGVTPTGALSLFGGNLFFSTFTPDVSSADACLKGQGVLWGVDYIETEDGKVINDDGTPVPRGRHQKIGAEALTTGTCPPSIPNADGRTGADYAQLFRCIALPPGSIVFGAGITQRPSCVTEPSSSIGIDPYTGVASSHTGISDINVGQFQLVAQTGPKAGGGTSGSLTNTYTRTLTPPLSTSRIDSWAAIIE